MARQQRRGGCPTGPPTAGHRRVEAELGARWVHRAYHATVPWHANILLGITDKSRRPQGCCPVGLIKRPPRRRARSAAGTALARQLERMSRRDRGLRAVDRASTSPHAHRYTLSVRRLARQSLAMAFAPAARLPALGSRQSQHKRSLTAVRRIVAPAGAPAGIPSCRRKADPLPPRAVSRDFGPEVELSFDDFDFPRAINDSPYGDPYVSGAQWESASHATCRSALARTAWGCYRRRIKHSSCTACAGPHVCNRCLCEERACGVAGGLRVWLCS